MISIKVDTTDWTKFRTKFKVGMSANMLLAMNDSMDVVGKHATRDMIQNPNLTGPRIPSPVPNIRTGRLRDSLTGKRFGTTFDSVRSIKNTGNGLLGEMGTRTPYAEYLEPKYPFLKPALYTAQSDIYTIFSTYLIKAVLEADYYG